MNFTAVTLPVAIKNLFELNHYEVSGPIQVHGAEIDLVAKHLSDPFAALIYIEATVEYVDNDKYGKDVGKLAMIGELEPGARRMIISSKGFTLPVKERADKSRITTLTYEELFTKFEVFEKYVNFYSGQSEEAIQLESLNNIYEEPYFDDSHGKELATEYLGNWKSTNNDKSGWLVVTGEYGTGKTALTKVLQYRWLEEYKINPQLPLPIRLELREFTKQFDARGLLHHFLDNNKLGHVSIDFLLTLIKSGRAVLLLDGYDEMAQYLHARERRTCLEALAELSAGGARGILTSRPNYFTETEELQVFEILYSSFQHGRYHLTSDSKQILEAEKQVDNLLEQFIDRYERSLTDLSQEQTEALIGRVLSNDQNGKMAVLNILHRIFRSVEGTDSVSLSGKPVIISYLLEVVEELKNTSSGTEADPITEWQVYKLIIDQLMLRDLRRCPEIAPDARRNFLRKIAIFLSKRENALINQESFKDLVLKEFKKQLNRLSHDAKIQQLERLFADLRTSATLTRTARHGIEGWKFSHNSLREFLVAESLLIGLDNKEPILDQVPISDAMKIFVNSIDKPTKAKYLNSLSILWKSSGVDRGKGQLLNLLWESVLGLYSNNADFNRECLNTIAGNPPQLQSIDINKLKFSSKESPADLNKINFQSSAIYDLSFVSADLNHSDFSNCTIENCNFSGCNLTNSSFSGSFMIEIDLTDCILFGCNFTKIQPSDISILLADSSSMVRNTLHSKDALGYLNYKGAFTDHVESKYIIQNHPKFPIVDKIIDKLSEQLLRQRRGLEQRGAARQNVSLAKSFISYLEQLKLVSSPKARKDLIEVTDQGRDIFNQYIKSQEVPEQILRFFED